MERNDLARNDLVRNVLQIYESLQQAVETHRQAVNEDGGTTVFTLWELENMTALDLLAQLSTKGVRFIFDAGKPLGELVKAAEADKHMGSTAIMPRPFPLPVDVHDYFAAPPGAHVLYAEIHRLCEGKHKDTRCGITFADAKKELGLDAKKFAAAIKYLERAGLISVTRGKRRQNVFRLLPPGEKEKPA